MIKVLKKQGFTLAEVLIALVIIGVIAALTVPTLKQNIDKREYVTGLQKANSVLKQAVQKLTYNYGYAVGDYSFFKNSDFIDEFAKVTSYVKKCDTTTECFGTTKYKFLSNADVPDSNFPEKKSLVTADGMMYLAWKNNYPGGGFLSSEDNQNCMYRIYVDVNGQKKPNKFGVDTFVFFLVDGKGIVPAGANSTNDCRKTGWGFSCTGKILKEGKITYL